MYEPLAYFRSDKDADDFEMIIDVLFEMFNPEGPGCEDRREGEEPCG